MTRDRNRLTAGLALVIGCLFGGLSGAAGGEFTTIAGWDHQLFPSYAVATATLRRDEDEEADETELGDPHGLFGIEIESPGDDVTIKVTIKCSEIMEPSTFTGTLATEGETYTIRPKIRYKYSALTQNKQATPITVTFRVELEDEEAEEESETLTMRSINDCPFAIVD